MLQSQGKDPKRRQLLINSRLQMAVLFYSVFLALLVSVFNYVFSYLSNADTMSAVPNSTTVVAIALFGGLFFFVATWLGLLLTNRIAGPIYHLQCHMQNAVEGKPVGELAFRDNDFFKEVLEPYNTLLRQTGINKDQLTKVDT